MECPICFNLIANSCLGSCSHHFCYECLMSWYKNGGKHCPVCKEYIYQIRLDKEFDIINNPTNTKTINDEIYFKNVQIKYCINKKLGITLKNNNGPGVIVEKVVKNMACYSVGISKYDIIFSINNIPCIDHKNAIEVLEKNYSINRNINLKIFKIIKN